MRGIKILLLILILMISTSQNSLPTSQNHASVTYRNGGYTPALETMENVMAPSSVEGITGMINRMTRVNDFLFATIDDRLYSIDIASVQNPGVVSWLPTEEWIYEIIADGTLLYARHDSGFSVIDINNGAEPTILNFTSYAGFAYSMTVVESQPVLFVDGRLLIYDCSTPTAPVLTENVTSPCTCIQLVAVGTTVYSFYEDIVYSLDFSDPSDISILDSIQIPGFAYRLNAQGNILLVSMNEFGVEILDISNPSSLAEIYQIEDVERPVDTAVDRGVLYIAQRSYSGFNDDRIFSAFNISTLTAPVLIGSVTKDPNHSSTPVLSYSELEVKDDIIFVVWERSRILLMEHDFDLDNLYSKQENAIGTDPLNSDTDGDLIPDDVELQLGTNPTVFDAPGDSDNDGLNDLLELQLGTDRFSSDTDLDGLPDGWEYNRGLDPTTWTTSTGESSEALTSSLLMSIVPAVFVTVLILATNVLHFDHPIMKKIRRRFLFFTGLTFLIGILLFAPLQMHGPTSPGENQIETESGSFSFTVRESPWYTNNVTIRVSYYAEYLENVRVTLNLYEGGSLDRTLELIIGMGSPYVGTESETEVFEIEPGHYTISWSSDPSRDITVEMRQQLLNMYNTDQRFWELARQALIGAGAAVMAVGLFIKFERFAK